MNLTAVLLLAVVLQVSAAGYAQQVTLHEKGTPLKTVLDRLHSQGHYDFIYTNDQLLNARPVTIDLTAIDFKEALRLIFASQPLNFVIDSRTVVLQDKPVVVALPIVDTVPGDLSMFVGVVTDLHDVPLSGAYIISKHHQIGTTTDLHGFFHLRQISERDTLLVSYIGFNTKTVPIGKDRFLSIRLEEATSGLDEVVVQAYGQTSRRLTTGDIGRVTAVEIAKQPITDPLQAIEGRIAGVVVTPQSGYESGIIKVEIRGRNAVNAQFTTDPLYVIDGVPLTILDVKGTTTSDNSVTNVSRGLDQTGLSFAGGQSPLYSINPSDIESIDVLKDADATAIYGSRGANGVILITTKKGKAGPNTFSLNIAEGVSSNTRTWPLLKTSDYLAMRREQFRNDGILPDIKNAPDLLVWDTTRYTDWPKFIYGGVGKDTKVSGSFSGGDEQIVYRLGLGYDNTSSIATRSGTNQRGSVALSIGSTSPNKRLVTSLSANYSYSLINQLDLSGQSSLPPDAPPVYDSSGKLNWTAWDRGKVSNPLVGLFRPYSSHTNSLSSHFQVDYTILKGLVVKASLGYNNNQSYQSSFTPIASQDPNTITPPTGSASFGNSRANNWIVEPQLTYSTALAKHKIDFLAGGTMQSNVTEGLAVTGTNYVSDIFLRSISQAPKISSSDNYGQYKYAGVFTRIGYNYNNQYILNLNGRRDGSSRFGPGNQFGNFGSVGAAWLASEDKHIRSFLPQAISFVKLNVTYGITGGDGVSDYAFISQWSNISGISPNTGTTILLPIIEPNANFHWQVNKKLEFNMMTELLQGRISVLLAYYRDRCNNQLVSYPLDEFTGFTSVVANRPADVQNSGFEATLNLIPVRTKDIFWMLSFNLGINRNKLLAYPGIEQSAYRYQYKIGASLNNTYLLHYAGIDPMTGQYTYTDYNHDGKISDAGSSFPGTGIDDRRVVVDMEPSYTGGISSSITYHQLSVSTSFSFVRQKGANLFYSAGGAAGVAGMANISNYVFAHSWTHPGQTGALFGRLSTGVLVNSFGTESDAGWSDASFFRMNTLAISYGLPDRLTKKAGIKGLNFNFQTHNLFVISPYRGLDPQVRTFGGLPPAKRIDTGLSFSF